MYKVYSLHTDRQKEINVNGDKQKVESYYFFTLVVRLFLFCSMIIIGDKLFAVPYKTKKIYLSFQGYE